jgi:hypothetical protein
MKAVDPVYEQLAAEWGCTRQRVHQIYMRGLEKLGGQESSYLRRFTQRPAAKLHRERVVWRLDVAIRNRREAKRAGDARAEYAAVVEIDWLLDALSWLEAARDGELEEHLREVEQEQDEPTVYTGTFHSQDRVMQSSVSGKWKGRHLATKGAVR